MAGGPGRSVPSCCTRDARPAGHSIGQDRTPAMTSPTVRQPPAPRRAYRLPHETAALAAAEVRAAARRRARRYVAVWVARLATIAGLLAGWQLIATYWLDRFSYSRPSDIAERLTEWFTSGTVVGSIWTQVSTTLQETAAGFVIGAASGLTA